MPNFLNQEGIDSFGLPISTTTPITPIGCSYTGPILIITSTLLLLIILVILYIIIKDISDRFGFSLFRCFRRSDLLPVPLIDDSV